MDNDLTRRAELLMRTLTDPEEWRASAVENPRRLATILEVCDAGEVTLTSSIIPAIERIRSLSARNTSSNPRTRRENMAEETGTGPSKEELLLQQPPPQQQPGAQENRDDQIRREQVQLAREGLALIRAGLKEKKDKNKLNALCVAWEACGAARMI